jgi:hypothetical protein
VLHGDIFGSESCKWTHKHDFRNNAPLEQLVTWTGAMWLELVRQCNVVSVVASIWRHGRSKGL